MDIQKVVKSKRPGLKRSGMRAMLMIPPSTASASIVRKWRSEVGLPPPTPAQRSRKKEKRNSACEAKERSRRTLLRAVTAQ
ncbi:hypothetical protein EYF80_019751 [Liparis tanakae]|uniref:Uncharacterized protein n=1 Tax=Liparis tanakae TaxID=230148 RepID=A0A4Z2HXL3_9TELE|nr:hypothetical protein EYF80_019751 [Liparis tanakae]